MKHHSIFTLFGHCFCSTLTVIFLVSLLTSGCSSEEKKTPEKPKKEEKTKVEALPSTPFITVLGVAQDAGYPQMNCEKSCCKEVWKDPSLRRMVSCLGLTDPQTKQHWLLDATPDFKDQWQVLKSALPGKLAGVLLTHGHIGHYTGLMHLGREAWGSKNIPVYAMPRMANYLRTNGPWSLLSELNNIKLQELKADSNFQFNSQISIEAIGVPHRDEFSETVGFRVIGPSKSLLFIPDIDKWQRWERSIAEEISKVDYAFLDGTFFRDGEIPGRSMAEIPHPFIKESLDLFASLPQEERQKIHFIHFNHTNPVLKEGSAEFKEVIDLGCKVAKEGQRIAL